MVAMVRVLAATWACLFGNKYAVARIANLTEDSGKGLTDSCWLGLWLCFRHLISRLISA
jgi:hypothetical protein